MRANCTAFLPPLAASHSAAVGCGVSLGLESVVFWSLCTSSNRVTHVRDINVRLSNLVKDGRCGGRGHT